MFVKNIINMFSGKSKGPVRRLYTEGWNQMGAVKRDVDRRTYGQLQNTIDAYTEEIPELRRFAKEIKKLNPKDLGTICDTLELSTHHSRLGPAEANIDAMYSKKLKEKLLPLMIRASKENPASMDLINAIINNTDSTTSKYALLQMSGGILICKDASRQMIATSKIIPEIAKEALQGGYALDLVKQKYFMDIIKSTVRHDTQPDMIKSLFKEVVPFTRKRPEKFEIDVLGYLTSKADIEDVRARLKILPKLLENIGDKFKDFDLVKYLTKSEK